MTLKEGERLAALEAKFELVVKHLSDEIAAHAEKSAHHNAKIDKKIEDIGSKVDDILGVFKEAKGGTRVVLIVAPILAAIGGFIAAKLPFIAPFLAAK